MGEDSEVFRNEDQRGHNVSARSNGELHPRGHTFFFARFPAVPQTMLQLEVKNQFFPVSPDTVSCRRPDLDSTQFKSHAVYHSASPCLRSDSAARDSYFTEPLVKTRIEQVYVSFTITEKASWMPR